MTLCITAYQSSHVCFEVSMSQVNNFDVVISYRKVGVVAYSVHAALIAAQKKYDDCRIDEVRISKTGKVDASVFRDLLVEFYSSVALNA